MAEFDDCRLRRRDLRAGGHERTAVLPRCRFGIDDDVLAGVGDVRFRSCSGRSAATNARPCTPDPSTRRRASTFLAGAAVNAVRCDAIAVSASHIAVSTSHTERTACLSRNLTTAAPSYRAADSWGSASTREEILAAVATSRASSGSRGLPTGNPTASRAALTAGMNGADMIASISG